MRNILCFFMVVIFIFSLSSCSKPAVQTTAKVLNNETAEAVNINTDASLTLSYSPSDTLNPYKTKSEVNILLCTLMYDSLVTVSRNFDAVLNAALSITNENKVYNVQINKNIVFWDDTKLSSSDVVYSLNTAKSSNSIFKERLSNVSSVSETDGGVKITLKEPDPYFANCLDFPIIKNNTNSKDIPIGSGRYILNDKTLSYNTKHAGEVPNIKTIHLIEMLDYETTIRSLEIGRTSLFYSDLSQGDISGLNGSFSSVPINHIIYMGMDNLNSKLSSDVKKAISLALDRDEISAKAFLGRAVSATGPFHPDFTPAKAVQMGNTAENIDEAVKLLEKEGYTNKDSSGIRSHKNGKRLSFDLIVNKDSQPKQVIASLIAEEFKTIGIQINIKKYDFEEYKNRITDVSNYDFYIGETKLTNNMNLTYLLRPGEPLGYGLNPEGTMLDTYKSFLQDSKKIKEFIDAFYGDLPFIPISYREGVVASSRNIAGILPSATGIFTNIEEWVTEE